MITAKLIRGASLTLPVYNQGLRIRMLVMEGTVQFSRPGGKKVLKGFFAQTESGYWHHAEPRDGGAPHVLQQRVTREEDECHT